jgi:hypothetical protein
VCGGDAAGRGDVTGDDHGVRVGKTAGGLWRVGDAAAFGEAAGFDCDRSPLKLVRRRENSSRPSARLHTSTRKSLSGVELRRRVVTAVRDRSAASARPMRRICTAFDMDCKSAPYE